MFSNDPGFRKQLEEAQKGKTFRIAGREYARIPCGFEEGEVGDYVLDTSFDEHDAKDAVCVDCDAPSGFLHLLGCECEQCPRCRGQALGCSCPYEDSEDWKPVEVRGPKSNART